MVTTETRDEIEAYLGQVPSWIAALPDSTAGHSWRISRDLLLKETELTQREKALIGLGGAAAAECPYCVYFHKQQAILEDVTESELAEAVAVASDVRYFSTVLHGAEIDLEDFEAETREIIEYITETEPEPE